MPIGFTGVKQPRPWFANANPWLYWSRPTAKQTIGSGAPQHVLSPSAQVLGFNANVSIDVSSNAGGGHAGDFPATVGTVLNLSAAQIASAPAFNKHNLFD